VLEVHGERILKGNYVPGFKTKLYHKDLGIVGQTIHELDVPAPVAALVQQYVSALMAAGSGRRITRPSRRRCSTLRDSSDGTSTATLQPSGSRLVIT